MTATGWAERPIVLRREDAAETRRHAEAGVVVAGHQLRRRRDLRLTVDEHVRLRDRREGEDLRQRRTVWRGSVPGSAARTTCSSFVPSPDRSIRCSPRRATSGRSRPRRRGTARAPPGCCTGSERSRNSLTRLKIAVLAPMPSASDSTAIDANPGFSRSSRAACRRSRQNASSTPIVFMRKISSRMSVAFPSFRRAADRACVRRQAARDLLVDLDREMRLDLEAALIVPSTTLEETSPRTWTCRPEVPPYSSRSASVGSRRDARSAGR